MVNNTLLLLTESTSCGSGIVERQQQSVSQKRNKPSLLLDGPASSGAGLVRGSATTETVYNHVFDHVFSCVCGLNDGYKRCWQR